MSFREKTEKKKEYEKYLNYELCYSEQRYLAGCLEDWSSYSTKHDRTLSYAELCCSYK